MNISLESSIRTCKTDSGWANRMQSDRFLNSNNMVCPVWTGFDGAGRPACLDSYNTKTAGCNSAVDRVAVENFLRPQYIEYVNLDAAGIRGGQQCGNNTAYADTICRQKNLLDAQSRTGSFGMVSPSQAIFPNCNSCQNLPEQQPNGFLQMGRGGGGRSGGRGGMGMANIASSVRW
jgi:hypothetical protein